MMLIAFACGIFIVAKMGLEANPLFAFIIQFYVPPRRLPSLFAATSASLFFFFSFIQSKFVHFC